MTYLMTDIVHVIYGFMSSAMRLRTTKISLHETRFPMYFACASSPTQERSYHGICYINDGVPV